MDLFFQDNGNNESYEARRIRHIMILYIFSKDFAESNNENFSLKNDHEILDFFNKYEKATSFESMKLDDFPVEKVFLNILPIYKKIKSGEYKININEIEGIKINLKNDEENDENNDKLKNDISESISETFTQIFEEEIIKLEIQSDNEELKDFQNSFLITYLEEKMNEYVKNEEYEKAADIRDQINSIQEDS